MKQQRTTTRRHQLDPAQWREALDEIMPVGDDAAPSSVVGWSKGKVWTRIKATYPNGFELTVHCDRQGNISSSSAKAPTMVMAGKPAHQEASA